MPELPEAETIARTLAPQVEGRLILEARFLARRALRGSPPALEGRRVHRVRRHGKGVVFDLDGGVLLIKLGMTGGLLLNREPGPHTRAWFRIGESSLCFDDIRQFGSIAFLDRPPCRLGPDPLEIDAGEFITRLRSKRAQLKRLLLDQSFLRGLGNIYTDEALFRAGIHPLTRSERLSRRRAERLHEAIVAVLNEAIAAGGSSVSNYVDAFGGRGRFQEHHRVYGRDGEPCPACGSSILYTVVAQRGTRYCPRCQRR